MGEDHAGRLTRRIESFSDLVMGFSLALLGLTLVVPAHTIDFFANPWLLIGYFWTIAVIVSLWLTHQRIFALYFDPNPQSIAANFIFLSMLGLIVYFVQVFAHMRLDADKALAFLAYFGALAIAIGSLGLLFLFGVRARAEALTPKERTDGNRRAVRHLIQGVALLATVLIELRFVSVLTMTSTIVLLFVAIGGRLIGRAVNHWLLPA